MDMAWDLTISDQRLASTLPPALGAKDTPTILVLVIRLQRYKGCKLAFIPFRGHASIGFILQRGGTTLRKA